MRTQEQIVEIVERLNIKQATLAQRAGMSSTTISQALNPDLVARIDKALDEYLAEVSAEVKMKSADN